MCNRGQSSCVANSLTVATFLHSAFTAGNLQLQKGFAIETMMLYVALCSHLIADGIVFCAGKV